MYILYKPLAILGSLIVGISAIIFPFLKVPLVGNWNLYQTDVRLFLITYVILSVCILLFILRKIQAYRIATILLFVWSILAIVAVYFTLNNYFGFKIIDGLVSKAISFKWGWIVFLLGTFIMLFSTRKVKLNPPIQPSKSMLA